MTASTAIGRLAGLLAAAALCGAAVPSRATERPAGPPRIAVPARATERPAAPPRIVVAGPAVLARPPAGLAELARQLEDDEAWDSAAVVLQALRTRVPPDPDLELALALNLGRAGALDSARAVLLGPVLRRAVVDTCPPNRRRPYGPGRERLWLNGAYDGWRWYPTQALAEVDARLGRWVEALAAAGLAVSERPLLGRGWLIAAVCSARAGDLDGAESGARLAAFLDPMLPEAQYLAGLFDWRAGRRADALRRFGAAVALDSLYEPAVRARQRLRFFPGAAPDSLPAVFLTGPRAAGLLTSRAGPKLESTAFLDHGATVLRRTMVPVPDSLQVAMPPLNMVLLVLVDERGHPVLCDLPWIAVRDLPGPLVSILLESLPGWRFAPAQRFGLPVPSWTTVSITTGSR